MVFSVEELCYSRTPRVLKITGLLLFFLCFFLLSFFATIFKVEVGAGTVRVVCWRAGLRMVFLMIRWDGLPFIKFTFSMSLGTILLMLQKSHPNNNHRLDV